MSGTGRGATQDVSPDGVQGPSSRATHAFAQLRRQRVVVRSGWRTGRRGVDCATGSAASLEEGCGEGRAQGGEMRTRTGAGVGRRTHRPQSDPGRRVCRAMASREWSACRSGALWTVVDAVLVSVARCSARRQFECRYPWPDALATVAKLGCGADHPTTRSDACPAGSEFGRRQAQQTTSKSPALQCTQGSV